MSLESLCKDISDLIGHDVDKVSAVIKNGKLTIIVEDVDEDDFDDAEENFDDDE